MGVSGIGQSGDMAAMRKELMQGLFKKMDSDGNGAISKDELQKAVDGRKPAAGKDAPADAPSVDDLFKSADANGDGGISQDELLTQMSMMGPPKGKGGPPPAGRGGPPPAGRGGPPPTGASDKAASSASSSKLSTDAADTDGDGKVSAAERRAYDYKQMMKTLIGAVKDGAGATNGSPSNTKVESVSVVA